MSYLAQGLTTRAVAAADAPTIIATDQAMPAAWRRAMASSDVLRRSKPPSASSSSSSSIQKLPSQDALRDTSRQASRLGSKHNLKSVSRFGSRAPTVTRAQLPPLYGGQAPTPFLTRARNAASNIMASKLLTAAFVFFFTMMALLAINPPMARDAEDPRRRSWYKITIWSLLAFCAALCLPWCFPTARVSIE